MNQELKVESTRCWYCLILDNQSTGILALFSRVYTIYSLICDWRDANRAMNANKAPPSNKSLDLFWFPKLILESVPKKIKIQYNCRERHIFWNQTSPEYIVQGRPFSHTKKFSSNLGKLAYISQIIAISVFPTAINMKIYIILAAIRNTRKELTSSHPRIWSSFLVFNSFIVTFIHHYHISVLSYPLFSNLFKCSFSWLTLSLAIMLLDNGRKLERR